MTTTPEDAGLPPTARQALHEAVAGHIQRVRDGVDAATPDVLDGLISRWADQWLAAAEQDRLRALAALEHDRALVAADLAAARARLRVVRERRRRLAEELGQPPTPTLSTEET